MTFLSKNGTIKHTRGRKMADACAEAAYAEVARMFGVMLQ
jgi:hypothetical protein